MLFVSLSDVALGLAVVGPLACELGLAEVGDGAFAPATAWRRLAWEENKKRIYREVETKKK